MLFSFIKRRTILFTIVVLLFSLSDSIPAANAEKAVVAFSTGVTVDIAPFGVEQVYFTGQAEGFLAGAVAPGAKASYAVNADSTMLRLPAVVRLLLFRSADGVLVLSGYGGAGVELYRSELHNTDSLMLTGGVSLLLGWLYVDLPVVRALRAYNTDSDFGLTAGLCLRW